MALTYLNSKMIEEPAILGQLFVTSLTALSTTIQNTLTNYLTSLTVTDASVISVNSLQDALRITQTGSGNALLVEDSENLDGTPFVITSGGNVGIGVLLPTTKLDVNGTIKGDALQVNNIQSTNIQGTNATFTNTGTFPTLVSTNVTTQNVVFPQNGTGNIVNDAAFYGNLTIYGAISALSGLSVTSTFTSQSSALSVVNTGPEIALFVSQGPNLSGVATFVGSDIEVLKINNPNPNPNNLPAVVVNGVLSASGGTSTNWNATFTNVQSNSANWNSAYVTTTALSSNFWNSVYTNVQSNSANYVLQGGNTLAADLSVGTTNTRNLVLETNSIERMRISSTGNVSISGNVGIGRAASGYKLHVQGDTAGSANWIASQNDNATFGSHSGFLAVANGLNNYIALYQYQSGLGYLLNQGPGEFIIGTNSTINPGTSLIFQTSGSERMRIDSNGNVGIGTADPTQYGAKLAIVAPGGNDVNTLAIGKTDPGSGANRLTSKLSFRNTGGPNNEMAAIVADPDGNTSYSLGFTANGAERMRINSAGNVGIGTTTPLTRLDVRGDVTVTDGNNGISLRNAEGCVEIYRTAGNPYIDFKTSGGEDFDTRIQQIDNGLSFQTGGYETRINSSGNVGIGTTTPAAKLQVAGTTGNVQFRAGTSSNGYFEVNSFDSDPTYCVVGGTNTTAGVFGTQTNVPTLFFTNNTEKMRIDTNGNVGIGTATPASLLHFKNDVAANGYDTNMIRLYDNGTGSVYGFTIASGTLGYRGNNHVFYSSAVTPVERVRINTDGLIVGAVGNNSQGLVRVNGSGMEFCSGIMFNLTDANASTDRGGFIDFRNENDIAVATMQGYMTNASGASGSAYIKWETTQAGDRTVDRRVERMRLTPAGHLLIGRTSDLSFSTDSTDGISITANNSIAVSRNNDINLFLRRRSGDGRIAEFHRNAAGQPAVGWINVTTGGTTYNTSSDYRLKDNITPLTGGLTTIDQLKPVEYTWKLNNSEGRGFIAHELQSVVPEAVTGEKDAVDENGDPQYQGVDASRIVPYLVSAIKELKSIIDNQSTTILALENRIQILEA